ncbi:MAG TPA: trypsin-like peptidase domain-containing protein, partial [Acidobacteriaceae bacterium]|nr:trypsin-like peptidase domain-containing protein [Acidobacteriaceae bacterium]
MKARLFLLTVAILGGFYLALTHAPSTGGAHERLIGAMGSPQESAQLPRDMQMINAHAAPGLLPEEQNNIAVYKKALPSVVNITSTIVKFDFFYGAVPEQGQGSGFILDSKGHILTNLHVVSDARTVEVTLFNKHQYKAKVLLTDKAHD